MMQFAARASRVLSVLLPAVSVLAGCGGGEGEGEPDFTQLRVYSSPYANVDWQADQRLKAQHHDHTGISETRIRAYDTASYDVIGLMTYSGNRSLDYAWTERHWPPDAWLSPSFLGSLTSIKVFVPNAEQVGDPQNHVTSPGLKDYVEVWPGSGAKQAWQYSTIPELFGLIRQGGGLPCFAHSWNSNRDYSEVNGEFCVEIYNAYAEAQRRKNNPDFTATDRNSVLVANWDRALARNQRILAIAVNDHYGPDTGEPTIGTDIIDSGYIVVLSKAGTLDAYLAALRERAVLAIRDSNPVKGETAELESITVDATSVTITTTGQVRWISNGNVIAEGTSVSFSSLPANTRYVRAEIGGSGSATTYTQAFTVRPVGDVDGDYDIDDADRRICSTLGPDPDPVHDAACKSAP
jgi:hypothetical protein